MALDHYPSGFRLIDGDQLNKMVDVVNGATPAAGLANGTAAAPSLSFASNTNTGLYRVGANQIGVAAGGSEVGAFDANGFNGIVGGTTPAAASVTTVTASGTVDLQGAVFALDNFVGGLTAHAGGGQGSALALTKAVNRVDTVGTAADSVALPAPSKVGQLVVVINNAASNSMQVFGAGTDTINGVASATGVAQAAGKTGIYVATSTGTAAAWFRLLSA